MNRRRAFTLMEVLIALSLGAALLASAFSFYFNLLNARARLINRADQQRAADVVLDQIESMLTTGIVGTESTGPGVKGNSTSLTLTGRSVAAQRAGLGLNDAAVFDDLQTLQIQFRQNDQTITISGRSPLNDDAAQDASQTLTQSIARLRFRYYDGSRWRDTFDSQANGGLPIEVEVAMWFEAEDDENAGNTAENEELNESGGTENAGGFDEFAFAMRDDRGFESEPLPDRIRVMRVPDASDEQGGGEQ